jgi:hypothetical protein
LMPRILDILPLPMYLHDVELNWLSTWKTLPFHFTFWKWSNGKTVKII